ncbi:hypothetical protein ACIBLB_40870 [Streptosporangium canum]|uniref:hypothetical protein n=1 Tax=Streptosporangium canum TaxID=324952 RepID=UPI0037BAE265
MSALLVLGELGSHLAPSWTEITASAHTAEMNTFDLDELGGHDATAYALLSLIPALVADIPDRPEDDELRQVPRNHVLLPEDRRGTLTRTQTVALRWLEKASLPLADLQEARLVRIALDAISATFDGKEAAANTVRRKRAILHHLLEPAVEQKVFATNPLHEIKWKPPKAVTVQRSRRVIDTEARLGPRHKPGPSSLRASSRYGGRPLGMA